MPHRGPRRGRGPPISQPGRRAATANFRIPCRCASPRLLRRASRFVDVAGARRRIGKSHRTRLREVAGCGSGRGPGSRVSGETASIFTCANPAFRKPSASAAAVETSMTRPRMNGPRSMILRITERPLSRLRTFTRDPMPDKVLADLRRRLDPLARASSPLSAPPPRKTRFGSPLVLSRVHWVEPQLVAEITYLTWTGDGLLRHTVYLGLRSDKPAREVRREARIL